jgi:hypothetical protein
MRGLPTLNGVEAQLTMDNGNLLIPRPANLFEVCPAARLPFVHVTYDWDVERKQYVPFYNVSHALTRTQLIPGRSVPSTIPRSVQDSAEPNGAAMAYLGKNSQTMPYLVVVYPYATVTSFSYCQPSSPPA